MINYRQDRGGRFPAALRSSRVRGPRRDERQRRPSASRALATRRTTSSRWSPAPTASGRLGQQSDDSNDNSSPRPVPGSPRRSVELHRRQLRHRCSTAAFRACPCRTAARTRTTATLATAWTRNYRAIASASDGLRAFSAGPGAGPATWAPSGLLRACASSRASCRACRTARWRCCTTAATSSTRPSRWSTRPVRPSTAGRARGLPADDERLASAT